MSIFNTVLSFYVTLSVLSMQVTVLVLGRIKRVILCSDFTINIQSLLQVNCLAFKTCRAVLLLHIAPSYCHLWIGKLRTLIWKLLVFLIFSAGLVMPHCIFHNVSSFTVALFNLLLLHFPHPFSLISFIFPSLVSGGGGYGIGGWLSWSCNREHWLIKLFFPFP
jgi:hypothetical protein